MNGNIPKEGENTDALKHELIEIDSASEIKNQQQPALNAIKELFTERTTPEVVEKVMDKVVDIYCADDLKYRDSYDPVNLAINLHFGIISPYNKHIFQEELSLTENIHRVKQFAEEEAAYRESVNSGTYSKTDYAEYKDRKKFSHSANVFYPEGALKIAAKFLAKEDIGDENELSVHKEYTQKILQVFLDVFKDIADKDTAKGACRIFLKKFPDLLENDGLPVLSESDCDYFKTDAPDGLEERARKYFIDNYENIRKKWLERFFKESMNSRGGSMVHYTPSLGCIFGSNAEVCASWNDDYPTQASLLNLNNKRHIVGIFINEHVSAHSMEMTEFPDAPRSKDITKNEIKGDLLKRVHFEILPENSPQFFWDRFGALTEKSLNGITSINPVLAELVSEVRSLEKKYKEANEAACVSRFDSRRHLFSDAEKANAQELEKQSTDSYNNMENRKKNLSEEEKTAIYHAVRKYLDEFTPFKDGQSAWNMVVSLGEYHHLPVYNLKGDLLWPKQMSHKELKEFIAVRDATDTDS